MGGHELSGIGEGGHEGEFAAEDGGGADQREAAGVGARFAGFPATKFRENFFDEWKAFPVADGADD